MRGSNYEIMKKDAQKLFLNYDQQRMIEKFNLEHDIDYLYLEFVSHRYRIDRHTGETSWLETGAVLSAHTNVEDSCSNTGTAGGSGSKTSGDVWQEAGFEEVLSILDVLCCARDDCHLSGNYCSISNVKGASLAAAPGNDMFAPSARVFDHQTARLAAACEALGGTKGTVGDVSYTLPIFPFLSIQLQFWESDDEFPPCLKFMWDENILQYMHFETTFYVAGHVINRLQDML